MKLFALIIILILFNSNDDAVRGSACVHIFQAIWDISEELVCIPFLPLPDLAFSANARDFQCSTLKTILEEMSPLLGNSSSHFYWRDPNLGMKFTAFASIPGTP